MPWPQLLLQRVDRKLEYVARFLRSTGCLQRLAEQLARMCELPTLTSCPLAQVDRFGQRADARIASMLRKLQAAEHLESFCQVGLGRGARFSQGGHYFADRCLGVAVFATENGPAGVSQAGAQSQHVCISIFRSGCI